ncbi:AAA family ATPase [Caulobacter sp. Root655]|uniref:AAA family ATPase n=1 Tax=Caulobacter sp. Root655 TaxID=1736578 RepID=UPI0009EC9521|nr:AAA family ATPase [Caulobacter sp. Root655]
MLTRIEIDGFKTFENFSLDLRPFSAIVGPNASGKSNLFDAIKFLSLLSQHDIRTAMQDLRGEPEELFRITEDGSASEMSFATEVLLESQGVDAFGAKYNVRAQRLRYELTLAMKLDSRGFPKGIFVTRESCAEISKKNDTALYLKGARVEYSGRKTPFISIKEGVDGEVAAFEIRQDGPAGDTGATKRGRPVTLPALEASRTALSTITTAEFPHLYALRDVFTSTRFLEINPQAARRASDRFELKQLRPDASNLAAVLARLQDETSTDTRPNGVISDISVDLASLIPAVRQVKVYNDANAKEYSFAVSTSEKLNFSSRVISDGTIRLLALLSILDDPQRRGILCFEEPENGVHEGRIEALVSLLREAASTKSTIGEEPLFQVLINTHSPAVMHALEDNEIVAADAVSVVDPATKTRSVKTRMRTGVETALFQLNPETDMTRKEVENLLRKKSDEA